VTPLERHCGWLLHAYPSWYRRERAGEMLDTLLEASPPGMMWPSFRDARSLIIGGLRVRGLLVLCLSVLWTGLGAAGAGYNFILSTHVPQAVYAYVGIDDWVGEPSAFSTAALWGALAWLLLTIPVLVAGLVRLGRRLLPAGSSAVGWVAAWTGAWLAGLALMFPIANWEPSAPAVYSGNCWEGSGCVLAGYRYAVVSWGELAVVAGWLALGAAMTLMLARSARQRARCVPDRTVTGTWPGVDSGHRSADRG
jgi:hypothetical protein